jgi:hypothetical protein
LVRRYWNRAISIRATKLAGCWLAELPLAFLTERSFSSREGFLF